MFLAIIFMIFLSTTMTTGAKEPSEPSIQTWPEQEWYAWQKGFYQHLLEHKNTELRAYGIYFMAFEIESGSETLFFKINKIFKDLINETDLSAHSLNLLAYTCMGKEIKESCDFQLIFEKLKQISPTNLNTYILSLNQAIANNEPLTVRSIINDMSNTEYNKVWINYSLVFEKALEDYVMLVPLPQINIDFEIEALKKKSILSFQKIIAISNNMSDYLLFTIKTGINMAIPYPVLDDLDKECIKQKNLLRSCLKIAEIMITKSNSTLSQHYGHRLKVELLKFIGNNEESEKALDIYKAYRKKIECFKNLAYPPHLFKTDFKQEKLKQQVIREKGEIAGLYAYAMSKYQKMPIADSRESYNPDTCMIQ